MTKKIWFKNGKVYKTVTDFGNFYKIQIHLNSYTILERITYLAYDHHMFRMNDTIITHNQYNQYNQLIQQSL